MTLLQIITATAENILKKGTAILEDYIGLITGLILTMGAAIKSSSLKNKQTMYKIANFISATK